MTLLEAVVSLSSVLASCRAEPGISDALGHKMQESHLSIRIT